MLYRFFLWLLPANVNNFSMSIHLWEISHSKKIKLHYSCKYTLLIFPPVKFANLFSDIVRTLDERCIVYLFDAGTIFLHLKSKHTQTFSSIFFSPPKIKQVFISHTCLRYVNDIYLHNMFFLFINPYTVFQVS